MGKDTKIAWCDDTFNPWVGCMKISEACKHCYAAVSTPARTSRAKGLELWGPPATTARKRTSAANWRMPRHWNREALASGVRRRVFCASLADVFESHPELDAIRADLWRLIEECTGLDWLLLTKRPQHVCAMVPPAWLDAWPAHVWIGTTVESQASAAERIHDLLKVPAEVRFLSCEPLLEAVDLSQWIGPCCEIHDAIGRGSCRGPEVVSRDGVEWVIVGGESGHKARSFDLAWARSIVAQCREGGVPVFVKQVGARPVDSARAAVYQPCIHEGRPAIRTTIHAADAPEIAQARIDERNDRLRLTRPQVQHPLYLREHFRFDDRAGADPAEWSADLRVQEFPEVRR